MYLKFIRLIFALGVLSMARGYPDDGISPYSYASQISDPGLIYQMLWGFSPIDGQGRVLYMDTFNNGAAGVAGQISGTGQQPTLFSTFLSRLIFSPPNCIALHPGTTAGSFSGILREFYLGISTRLGIEAALVLWEFAPDYQVSMDYRIDANRRYTALLKYNAITGAWSIATTGGDINIFTSGPFTGGRLLHAQIKLVGDWNTGKYVRALIGENLIDISMYNMPASSFTFNGYAAATVRGVYRGALTSDGYLGYILLTKDEP